MRNEKLSSGPGFFTTGSSYPSAYCSADYYNSLHSEAAANLLVAHQHRLNGSASASASSGSSRSSASRPKTRSTTGSVFLIFSLHNLVALVLFFTGKLQFANKLVFLPFTREGQRIFRKIMLTAKNTNWRSFVLIAVYFCNWALSRDLYLGANRGGGWLDAAGVSIDPIWRTDLAH